MGTRNEANQNILWKFSTPLTADNLNALIAGTSSQGLVTRPKFTIEDNVVTIGKFSCLIQPTDKKNEITDENGNHPVTKLVKVTTGGDASVLVDSNSVAIGLTYSFTFNGTEEKSWYADIVVLTSQQVTSFQGIIIATVQYNITLGYSITTSGADISDNLLREEGLEPNCWLSLVSPRRDPTLSKLELRKHNDGFTGIVQGSKGVYNFNSTPYFAFNDSMKFVSCFGLNTSTPQNPVLILMGTSPSYPVNLEDEETIGVIEWNRKRFTNSIVSKAVYHRKENNHDSSYTYIVNSDDSLVYWLTNCEFGRSSGGNDFTNVFISKGSWNFKETAIALDTIKTKTIEGTNLSVLNFTGANAKLFYNTINMDKTNWIKNLTINGDRNIVIENCCNLTNVRVNSTNETVGVFTSSKGVYEFVKGGHEIKVLSKNSPTVAFYDSTLNLFISYNSWSNDGKIWSDSDSPVSNFKEMCVYNGVGISSTTSGTIWKTTDGKTWTEHSSSIPQGSTGLTCCNNVWFSFYLRSLYKSSDGINWGVALNSSLLNCTYDVYNSSFGWCVSIKGDDDWNDDCYETYVSNDGESWRKTNGDMKVFQWDDDYRLAIAFENNNSNVYRFDDDNDCWVLWKSYDFKISQISVHDDKAVIRIENGEYKFSYDFDSWETVPSIYNNKGLYFKYSKWFTDNGSFSNNGVDWTVRNLSTDCIINENGFVWNPSYFYDFENGLEIKDTNLSKDIGDIMFYNGTWYSNDSKSTDGVHWTNISHSDYRSDSIVYDGTWVSKNGLYYSLDGLSWYRSDLPYNGGVGEIKIISGVLCSIIFDSEYQDGNDYYDRFIVYNSSNGLNWSVTGQPLDVKRSSVGNNPYKSTSLESYQDLIVVGLYASSESNMNSSVDTMFWTNNGFDNWNPCVRNNSASACSKIYHTSLGWFAVTNEINYYYDIFNAKTIVIKSSDGKSWENTSITLSSADISHSSYNIFEANGLIYASIYNCSNMTTYNSIDSFVSVSYTANGVDWIKLSIGAIKSDSILYDGSKFIMSYLTRNINSNTAYEYIQNIATSDDGVSWSVSFSEKAKSTEKYMSSKKITHDSSKGFMASDGIFSENGIDWVKGEALSLNSGKLVLIGDRFVTVGNRSTTDGLESYGDNYTVWFSDNGKDWKKSDLVSPTMGSLKSNRLYSNGTFALLILDSEYWDSYSGTYYRSKVYVSLDGEHWNAVSISDPVSRISSGVCDGKIWFSFAIVASTPQLGGIIESSKFLISENGTDWDSNLIDGYAIRKLYKLGSIWLQSRTNTLTRNELSTNGKSYWSDDYENWNEINGNFSFSGCAKIDNIYMGNNGRTNKMCYSTDGKVWTDSETSNLNKYDSEFFKFKNLYFTGSFYSVDGKNWEAIDGGEQNVSFIFDSNCVVLGVDKISYDGKIAFDLYDQYKSIGSDQDTRNFIHMKNCRAVRECNIVNTTESCYADSYGLIPVGNDANGGFNMTTE